MFDADTVIKIQILCQRIQNSIFSFTWPILLHIVQHFYISTSTSIDDRRAIVSLHDINALDAFDHYSMEHDWL